MRTGLGDERGGRCGKAENSGMCQDARQGQLGDWVRLRRWERLREIAVRLPDMVAMEG